MSHLEIYLSPISVNFLLTICSSVSDESTTSGKLHFFTFLLISWVHTKKNSLSHIVSVDVITSCHITLWHLLLCWSEQRKNTWLGGWGLFNEQRKKRDKVWKGFGHGTKNNKWYFCGKEEMDLKYDYVIWRPVKVQREQIPEKKFSLQEDQWWKK